MTITKLSWYTYNRLMEKLRGKTDVPMTRHNIDNYQTTLFDISTNCLVCGNSDKIYGDKDGHELIFVRIFNF